RYRTRPAPRNGGDGSSIPSRSSAAIGINNGSTASDVGFSADKSPRSGPSRRKPISTPSMDTPTLRKRARPTQVKSVVSQPPVLASAIEQMPIESLTPYAGNSRKHDERQVTKLCSIIRKVGML